MHRHMKWILLATIGLLICLFLYRVRKVLTGFWLAGILAYIIYPIIERLDRREVPRPVSILVAYALVGVVGFTAYQIALPMALREIDEILTILPRQSYRIEGISERAVRDLRSVSLPPALRQGLEGFMLRLQQLLEHSVARMTDGILTLIIQMLHLLLGLVLSYYLLRDLDDMKSAVMRRIPIHYRGDMALLASRIHQVIGGFIRGQLLVSMIVGALITVGLLILGIPNAFVIGMIAGVFDLIPYFGPIIGTIPAVAFALLKSPLTALYVVLLMIIVNQLEGAWLGPKIVGDSVGLHPIVVIFAILVGGELGGIIGMLVAVPIAATLREVARYAWQRWISASFS